MPLRDDDISSENEGQDLNHLALAVIANAARDLSEHMQEHNMPSCVIADCLVIADAAEAAVSGTLTQQHIANFRWFLAEHEAGPAGGHD